MMRVLHNEQLVETFLTETAGAPVAVRAALRVDKATPTGYRWSSGKGPEIELTSGTRCDAEVTTRSQRPIALLLPILDTDG
jgi:HlyD family secretion protein